MMTPEDSMRDRISAELNARRPPLGDLVGQAVAEGRRNKRRTRLGVYTLSTAGVLVVAGAVVQFAPSSSRDARPSAVAGTPVLQPAATTPKMSTTPSPLTPIVKQVDPGTTMLAKGLYLNYTTDSMSWWDYEDGLTTRYTGGDTWGSDFVAGSGTGRLLTGFYVGGDDVAAAAVTVDGKQYPAVVVKVTGSHGWYGLYYMRPPDAPLWHSVRIDVYDKNGKVLATNGVGETSPPRTTPHPGPRTLPVSATPINTPFPGATAMVPPGADSGGSEPGKH